MSIRFVIGADLDAGPFRPQAQIMLRFRLIHALGGMALTLTALIAPPNAAEGSIVQALALDELVAQSDRIVVGEVVFAEAFIRADGTIATWYRVRVEQNLRGDPEDTNEVIVETMGGQIGDIGMRVEGEPSFSVGERTMIFMRDGGDATFRPVGMGQGVMRIRLEGRVEQVLPSRQGMMLVRRNARGALVKSNGPLVGKERLGTFLTRVRDIVQAQRVGADE